jgi:hypothetical protein
VLHSPDRFAEVRALDGKHPNLFFFFKFKA